MYCRWRTKSTKKNVSEPMTLFIYVLPLENKINQKERIRTNDIVYIGIVAGDKVLKKGELGFH
jgi:hypothetical protein